jgi:tetratricopeptide (TPR) repeat protein
VAINMKIHYQAVLAGMILASLSGCQLAAKLSNSNQMPTAQAPAPKEEPVTQLTLKQKLDVQMAIARSLENDGETQQAIKAYLDIVEKDSQRVDAYHRLAILHDGKADHESARKFYELALKKNSKNAELHCDFGYSCYLQRKWSEAESHFRRAIALNENFARAHVNLGLMLARAHHESEALAEFYKAGLDKAAARNNIGFALTLEERWPEAKRQFELALAADPQSKMAKDGLAAIRWHNGESALQKTKAAEKRPPETSTTQTAAATPRPQMGTDRLAAIPQHSASGLQGMKTAQDEPLATTTIQTTAATPRRQIGTDRLAAIPQHSSVIGLQGTKAVQAKPLETKTIQAAYQSEKNQTTPNSVSYHVVVE